MMTPAPIRRETQLRTVAGEMTFRRGPGDIMNRGIGQDVVIETQRVGPEVNLDLANKPLHPPDTSFGLAPEVEGSIRREDARRFRMSRHLWIRSAGVTLQQKVKNHFNTLTAGVFITSMR